MFFWSQSLTAQILYEEQAVYPQVMSELDEESPHLSLLGLCAGTMGCKQKASNKKRSHHLIGKDKAAKVEDSSVLV